MSLSNEIFEYCMENECFSHQYNYTNHIESKTNLSNETFEYCLDRNALAI